MYNKYMEPVVEEIGMFKTFLNHIVQIIALIHRYIMSLNDNHGAFLSDKQLHFLVVGCLGLLILFVVYPLFEWLVRKNLLVIVAWIYTFCILIALTLLIEIGQDYTGTGTMDFADIMSGLMGFIIMSAFGIGLIVLIEKYKNKKKEVEETKEEEHVD